MFSKVDYKHTWSRDPCLRKLRGTRRSIHHTQGTYSYLSNKGKMEDSEGYGYLVVLI